MKKQIIQVVTLVARNFLQKSTVMYKHENIFKSLIPLTRDNTVDKDVKEEAYGIWPLVTG